MAHIQPTSRTRLWLRLLAGLLYLSLVSAILSDVTGHHFLPVLVGVIAGALFCSSLALVWLTLWAVRRDSRLGQFGIGSLFFLTLFVAMYFGLVRWLVVALESNQGPPEGAQSLFVRLAIFSLGPMLFSIPFVLGVTESLLWLAVWVLRRRPIRRLLAKRPPRDS